MTIEKYEIRNRWTGAVMVTAEISVTPDMMPSVKLGLAIKWAVKSGANLSDANLRGANLRDANLRGANLSGANLRDANLSDAYLSGAYLSGANLRDANLRDANLRGANLRDANLRDANLRGAKDAELAIAKTRILPDAGDVIGWKKCRDGVIVKLRIPEDAPRSHAFGRKCRAKFADVLEVIGAEVGVSSHDSKFTYRAGERVAAPNWCEDWTQECAGGVHFWITRLEAEAWT